MGIAQEIGIGSPTGLRIGPIEVPGRAFLAPMSGVSDAPFRRLALRCGAPLVVSEMVASEELSHGHPESVLRAEGAGVRPHVVQLAGREPRWMEEGARRAVQAGADIVDINMGCPARKVTSGWSGSALMRDLDHACRLIDATMSAVEVPVTLKMRLGWDRETINAPELARRAEALGIAMITVHGRTRCDFYNGIADWAAIRAVREVVSVPLVVNGDIIDLATARKALAASGADAVIIGRGAYGRPWIVGDVAHELSGGDPSNFEPDSDLVIGHYEEILVHYGIGLGLRAARKHLGWYLDVLAPVAADVGLRRRIMTAEDPRIVTALIRAALSDPGERRAA